MLDESTENSKLTKTFDLTKEFIRYFFVGGVAFILDTGILFLLQNFIFYRFGETGVLISTAFGFLAGLALNYILSIAYVFKRGRDKVEGRQVESFVIFAIIGVIGLVLTELGMLWGIRIFAVEHYLIIKVFVAAAVLIWNYVARKVFIFR